MKIKVECNSPLLQYTLEYFLKDFLDEKGIILTDNPEKDGIIIGRDIKKPFTKTSLLLQLEKILNTKSVKKETFEEKLDFLLDDFKSKLINLIKEYYGKK